MAVNLNNVHPFCYQTHDSIACQNIQLRPYLCKSEAEIQTKVDTLIKIKIHPITNRVNPTPSHTPVTATWQKQIKRLWNNTTAKPFLLLS